MSTPIALTPGVVDENEYGNKFNGVSNEDGEVSFAFDATEGDLNLSLYGYDVDWDDEIAVLLNGVSIGFLSAGPNNSLEAQSFLIAAADMEEGENTISFVQTYDAGFAWGVTNVMLDTPGGEGEVTDTPVANLTQGVVDTGSYGNRFDGERDFDGLVSYTFDDIGEDVVLSFDGYDLDRNGEVELYLNGTLVGPVDAGANNRLNGYSYEFAAEDLLDGQNTITFKQTINVNQVWGVTNVMFDIPEAEEVIVDTPVANLVQGVADAGEYGNRFNGMEDEDGMVTFSFDGIGEDIALSFDGYDFDNDGEIELYLNGSLVGPVDAGANNRLSSYTIEFAAADVLDGQNTVTFKQAENVNFGWGVTNIMFDTPEPEEVVVDTPVANLAFGVTDTGVYGNRFDGLSDDDGLISYTFDGTGEDIALSFDGYDFDADGEVELYLNGTLVGPVDAGTNNGLSSYTFEFAAADVLDGENTVTFKQTVNDAFIWGVTNVKIDTPVEDEEEVVVDTPVADLAFGVTDTGVYGNRFAGLTDDDGLISYTFDGTGEDIALSFDGYDLDTDGEVELYLNGTLVGPVDAGANNGLSSYTFDFAAADVLDGENTVTFKQTVNDAFIWGVTNVKIDTPVEDEEEVVVDTPVANLTLGVTDTGVYGNKFDGLTDDDGLISYTFDATGDDIVLDFDGYDFDTDGEVEVYLNGSLVAPVEAGTNNGFTSYRHEFAAEELLDGQNTVTFEQAAKVSFVWGVTNVNFHTSGDDQIAGDGGDDVLFGGEGNDTFQFGLGDDRDVISDFEVDGDVIELLNFGITEFSEISISNNADFDAVISFNATDVLTLTDVHAAQLTAEHFDFA